MFHIVIVGDFLNILRMIVNGLLCFAIHHLGSAANHNIELTLNNFYNHQDVVDAKEALWAACGAHLKPLTMCKKGKLRTAKEDNIEEIIEALVKLDAISKTPGSKFSEVRRWLTPV